MLLGDLGADVVRLDRPASVDQSQPASDFLIRRNSRSVAVDLKSPSGSGVVLRLIETADVCIEGWRPGIAERLGVGPEECLSRNPRLIYARATGWGQDGPYVQAPGHDINYIAVTGILHAVGRKEGRPAPPLNLVGDYGGGGMLCAVGILSALLETRQSGRGQVIDASMVDGAALLSTLFFGQLHLGEITEQRESNRVDGGAPWYDVYETSDGRYIAVGAGEAHLFAELLDLLDLSGEFTDPLDTATWPAMRRRFTEAFRRRTREEWESVSADSRYCLTPVLTWSEAPANRHNRSRGTYVDVVVQPAPAPRFSRTPGAIQGRPPWPGEHTAEVLEDWGFGPDELAHLIDEHVVRQHPMKNTVMT
jgi:alpha-methylacyl-CoA racemase